MFGVQLKTLWPYRFLRNTLVQVFLGEVASEKDYIATRVSYALNISGPSMTVNSACSSGLVAVAQAAAALQAGHCDMAIAGAASISFPNLGYVNTNAM